MNPNFWIHMLNMWVYGLSSVFLLFACFKLLDWLTPNLHFKFTDGDNRNIGVGIVVGSIFLSVAAVIVAILSN